MGFEFVDCCGPEEPGTVRGGEVWLERAVPDLLSEKSSGKFKLAGCAADAVDCFRLGVHTIGTVSTMTTTLSSQVFG